MHTHDLLSTLLELLLKSAAVVLLAAGVRMLLLRLSAARRHVLWLAAFATLLLLPGTKVWTPGWAWHLGKSRSVAGTSLTVKRHHSTSLVPVHVAAPGWREVSVPVKTLFRLPETRGVVVIVWLLGIGALLTHRLLGCWQLARLRRGSDPFVEPRVVNLFAEAAAAFGLDGRRLKVRFSGGVCVPMTWGFWSSVVLLPNGAHVWDDTQITAALRHELGHVQRRDYATRFFADLIAALYWPNPLVWLAARELRTAQEEACDNLVLANGTRADQYAALLFETARSIHDSRMLDYPQAVAMARPSTLKSRVLAIVDETRDRRPANGWAMVAGAVLATGLLSASSLAQSVPPEATKPRSTPSTPVTEAAGVGTPEPIATPFGLPPVDHDAATGKPSTTVSHDKSLDPDDTEKPVVSAVQSGSTTVAILPRGPVTIAGPSETFVSAKRDEDSTTSTREITVPVDGKPGLTISSSAELTLLSRPSPAVLVRALAASILQTNADSGDDAIYVSHPAYLVQVGHTPVAILPSIPNVKMEITAGKSLTATPARDTLSDAKIVLTIPGQAPVTFTGDNLTLTPQ